MRAGRKVIKVETTNRAGSVVLRGTAEVDQPVTAYVFTGQGSQEKVRGCVCRADGVAYPPC